MLLLLTIQDTHHIQDVYNQTCKQSAFRNFFQHIYPIALPSVNYLVTRLLAQIRVFLFNFY